MSLKVLFIATAENREMKIDDSPSDLPDLIDDGGNIITDVTSDLDKFKSEYFEIISSLYDENLHFKYTTIDPAYSENKVSNEDDPRYTCHISTLLEDIDISLYYKSFDLIFIATTYEQMFNIKNIDIMSKLLKSEGYLITTHPSGYENLTSHDYKFIKSFNHKTIFRMKT